MDTAKVRKDYAVAVLALRTGNITKVKEIIESFEETAKPFSSQQYGTELLGIAKWLKSNLEFMRINRLTKMRI